MSLKKDLTKEIHYLEIEIKELEIKRERSEASLIESLISKEDPDETEVQFFRQYTAEIAVKREKLADLIKHRNAL